MNENRRNILRIITLILLIFMVGFAWYHSSQPADISSEKSMGIVELLAKFGIVLEEHFIRKLGHFTEFTIIGGLLHCNLRLWLPKLQVIHASISGILAGLLVAMTDETIQLFVEGRSCEVADVWLDGSGVLLGTILVIVIFKIVKYGKIRKNIAQKYDI